MRTRSSALGLVVLGLALLAGQDGRAATEAAKPKPPARTALPTSLRGSQTPEPPPLKPSPAVRAGLIGVRPAGIAEPPSALASMLTPVQASAADVGQCRTTCAHTYYFCLSGVVTTDCSASWSQCLSDCSHPPLSIAR
jgi:hypothetical protein